MKLLLSAADEVETLFKLSLRPQVEALFKGFGDTYEALFSRPECSNIVQINSYEAPCIVSRITDIYYGSDKSALWKDIQHLPRFGVGYAETPKTSGNLAQVHVDRVVSIHYTDIHAGRICI